MVATRKNKNQSGSEQRDQYSSRYIKHSSPSRHRLAWRIAMLRTLLRRSPFGLGCVRYENACVTSLAVLDEGDTMVRLAPKNG